MDRRAFVARATLLVVGSFASQAHSQGRRYRIGLLFPEPRPYLLTPFVETLRDRGWVEGRDFTLEPRYTGGKPEIAEAMAQELARLKVDLIVTAVTGNAVAARRATSDIPIVMFTSGFPVESGLVKSYARPGGNVTGHSVYAETDLWGKYVELIREVAPRMAQLGVLWNYVPPFIYENEGTLALEGMKHAAAALKVDLRVRETRSGGDVEAALADLAQSRVDALFVSSGSLHNQPAIAARIVQHATERRWPTMTDLAGAVFTAGLLMTYTPNLPALARRTAHFVDRILRGARPGELPIERPAKFDLIIN